MGTRRRELRTRRNQIIIGAALVVAIVALIGVAFWADGRHSGGSNTEALPNDAPIIAPTPTLPPSPTILYYGDSITGGSFAERGQTFVELVTKAASAKPTVIAQAGVRTFAFLEAHPEPPIDADVTVVELGTNDVVNTDVAVFRETYRNLLNSIRKANPDSLLVCLGTWINPATAAPFDAAIYDECTAHDGKVVQLQTLYSQAANRGPEGAIIGGKVADNFHPNTAGHRAIAMRVLSALPGDPTITTE